MKTCALLLAACTLALAPVMAKAQEKPKPQDKIQTPQKFERAITKTLRADYLLFLPKGYEADPKKTWPMILFLHGAGERGTNLWRACIHGPSKYVVENPEFPFILVTPQCPDTGFWSDEVLLGLLDEVQAKHRVDKTRVYLTGLSMGGYGTWSLASQHPERFAAVAPICGGGLTIPILLAAKGYLPAKKKAFESLGIWAFHGGKDTVVPPSESEHMIEAMKTLKVKEIKYTLYPEATHDSWTETYNNPELYDWFLSYQRKP